MLIRQIQTGGIQTGGIQTDGIQTGEIQTGEIQTGEIQTGEIQPTHAGHGDRWWWLVARSQQGIGGKQQGVADILHAALGEVAPEGMGDRQGHRGTRDEVGIRAIVPRQHHQRRPRPPRQRLHHFQPIAPIRSPPQQPQNNHLRPGQHRVRIGIDRQLLLQLQQVRHPHRWCIGRQPRHRPRQCQNICVLSGEQGDRGSTLLHKNHPVHTGIPPAGQSRKPMHQ